MAEDIDTSVSYLKSLKEFSAPHNGTAAAPARAVSPEKLPWTQGTSANTAETFPGPEKRRSTRYRCEGSAGLREDGTEMHTWASFSDISLHGCYVEAQATYPVGTVLHLQLEANGVRLESTGTVRVSYPYLGMGIAFTDVSEQTITRLKEMLGSISRPTAIMQIASSLPAREPHVLPTIADPAAAVQSLTEYFENRQMLMREDFLRILRKSQGPDAKK